MDPDVDRRMQVLLDERDIARVLHRCATALDTGDWPLLRTCFLPDAVAVYEGLGESAGFDVIEQVCRTYLGPLTQTST